MRIYIEQANNVNPRTGYPLAIVRYIEEQYATVTLAETAAHFGYEATYVSRLIKRHLSKTFLELRNDIRLQVACHLLDDPTRKIEQIALEVGFSNLHYFYEVFKTRYGATPPSTEKTDSSALHIKTAFDSRSSLIRFLFLKNTNWLLFSVFLFLKIQREDPFFR